MLQSTGGQTVVVSDFRFAGNTLLTAKQLAPTVAGFKGRPLSFADLQNAAIEVATAYRKAGWIVRAYLPQQDITQGTVTIQIVEAKFGWKATHSFQPRVSSASSRMPSYREPP